MLSIDLSSLELFSLVCLILAAVMLVWNTVEVGRNDAANLINAVFGARILRRRSAVLLAGVAVVLGAVMSSDVMDTARKGIFDPTAFDTLKTALSVYISVYIVNTVLLYCYSAFGMPVSTTASLVFALLGAACAMDPETVNWSNALRVMAGIFCSIIFSGVAAFLIQRAIRGAIRDRSDHLPTLLLHGGWVGGGLTAGLAYYLLLKGMKNLSCVKQIKAWMHSLDELIQADVSHALFVVFLWGVFAITIHLLLVVYRKRAAKLLFPVLAVVGMMAMAFAFGQNDLANCASPGLSVFELIRVGDVEIASKVQIHWGLLLVCGLFLFAGMNTKAAERVTKAEIATGSAGDQVALWAPRWCVTLGEYFLRFRGRAPALAPRAGFTPAGKTKHYDPLRACVMMSVSACVIATASSLGLPVSTTYVAFAAVVATGVADRIFQRGDAELKLGRAIWVVTSWVLSAMIAACAAFLVALIVRKAEVWGIAGCLTLNLVVRHMLKRRADAQAKRVEDAAYERAYPDEFALEQEG